MIKLVIYHNHLSLPAIGDDEPIMLLHVYPAGDCDTCRWPMVLPWDGSTYTTERQRGILAAALFDAVEMGLLATSEGRVVLLPDNIRFNIDEELGKWEAMRREELRGEGDYA